MPRAGFIHKVHNAYILDEAPSTSPTVLQSKKRKYKKIDEPSVSTEAVESVPTRRKSKRTTDENISNKKAKAADIYSDSEYEPDTGDELSS